MTLRKKPEESQQMSQPQVLKPTALFFPEAEEQDISDWELEPWGKPGNLHDASGKPEEAKVVQLNAGNHHQVVPSLVSLHHPRGAGEQLGPVNNNKMQLMA